MSENTLWLVVLALVLAVAWIGYNAPPDKPKKDNHC